jgi:hypothetical protein
LVVEIFSFFIASVAFSSFEFPPPIKIIVTRSQFKLLSWGNLIAVFIFQNRELTGNFGFRTVVTRWAGSNTICLLSCITLLDSQSRRSRLLLFCCISCFKYLRITSDWPFLHDVK